MADTKKIEPMVPTTSASTPNYGLPQWEGKDLTDWYEFNPAFAKIDEAMHANEQAAETAQETANSNTASIANLTESLNNTIARVTSAENINTQQTQQITLNTTHLNEHDTDLQQINQQLEALQGSGSTAADDIAQLQGETASLTQKLTTAQQNIATNADAIGNLTGLDTTAKGNLVAAINEIVGGSGDAGASLSDIGNLEELTTTVKNNLVGAINEVKENSGKTKLVILNSDQIVENSKSINSSYVINNNFDQGFSKATLSQKVILKFQTANVANGVVMVMLTITSDSRYVSNTSVVTIPATIENNSLTIKLPAGMALGMTIGTSASTWYARIDYVMGAE